MLHKINEIKEWERIRLGEVHARLIITSLNGRTVGLQFKIDIIESSNKK